MDIDTTTTKAQEAAAALTGVDTTGFVNRIKGNAVKHIDRRHGSNGIADHSMSNIDDFSRIGFVLDNFTDASVIEKSDVDSDTWKLSKDTSDITRRG